MVFLMTDPALFNLALRGIESCIFQEEKEKMKKREERVLID